MAGTERFPDSAHFTEHGRELLVSMGLIEADPLRVAAERWLLEAPRQTRVTRAVAEALGDPYPAWMRALAGRFSDPHGSAGRRSAWRARKAAA